MQSTASTTQYEIGCGIAPTAKQAAALSEQCVRELYMIGATEAVALPPSHIDDNQWQGLCRFRATRAIANAYFGYAE